MYGEIKTYLKEASSASLKKVADDIVNRYQGAYLEPKKNKSGTDSKVHFKVLSKNGVYMGSVNLRCDKNDINFYLFGKEGITIGVIPDYDNDDTSYESFINGSVKLLSERLSKKSRRK